MNRLWPFFALVAAGLVGANARARAQEQAFELEAAVRAIDEVRFDDALQILDEALRQGGHSVSEVAEIYRLSAESEVALGHEDSARARFAELLLIAPSTQLGELVSPKIRAVFDAARAEVGDAKLELAREVSETPRQVSLVVSSDPRGMVAGARLDFTAAGSRRTMRGGGGSPIVFPLPDGALEDVALIALDAFGNELGALEVGDLLPVAEVSAPSDGSSTPLYQRWWLWAGVGAALGGAGAVFAIGAANAQDELDDITANSGAHTFAEAREVEDRGHRKALWANVQFGLAGAAGLAAAFFYYRQHRRDQADRDVAVVPSVGDGGAGVSVGLWF